MGCLLPLALIAILSAVALLWTAFSLVGLFLTLLIAGLIGAAADAVVPGRLPGGWLGAVLAGIAGGFVGTAILRLAGMHSLGPTLFGVHVIPAFVGALAISVAAELLTNSRRQPRDLRLPD